MLTDIEFINDDAMKGRQGTNDIGMQVCLSAGGIHLLKHRRTVPLMNRCTMTKAKENIPIRNAINVHTVARVSLGYHTGPFMKGFIPEKSPTNVLTVTEDSQI